MAMSNPAFIAWNKKHECIASLTKSFPLKLKDTFESPPDTLALGRFFLIKIVASKKSFA